MEKVRRYILGGRGSSHLICGCFLKWWYPQNTPKWSFLVGKPMVVGYHHFRKPPRTSTSRHILTNICTQYCQLVKGNLVPKKQKKQASQTFPRRSSQRLSSRYMIAPIIAPKILDFSLVKGIGMRISVILCSCQSKSTQRNDDLLRDYLGIMVVNNPLLRRGRHLGVATPWYQPNVGKYSIHGWYGKDTLIDSRSEYL